MKILSLEIDCEDVVVVDGNAAAAESMERGALAGATSAEIDEGFFLLGTHPPPFPIEINSQFFDQQWIIIM